LLRRPRAKAQPGRGGHRHAVSDCRPEDMTEMTEAMQTSTKPAATSMGIEVRLEQLRRVFAGVVALDELSLTLAPGELVALLGPSGCGKTTALRLVAGLDEVTSGKVLFGGTDVTTLGANKRDVDMVFQAYSLFPHMTARQNVAFVLQLRHADEHARNG